MSKKSFFEKLTGASEDSEEIEPEEFTKKVKLEKSPKSPNPIKGKPKKKTENKLQPKQDWSPEEEGQLTIDVYQTNDDITIKSTIAGVSAEDLDVSVINDMITIKGIRQKDEDISPENYYYEELYWGPFSRSVILPMDIDANKIKASIKNGILTIKLSKKEKIKSKKIKVKEIE